MLNNCLKVKRWSLLVLCTSVITGCVNSVNRVPAKIMSTLPNNWQSAQVSSSAINQKWLATFADPTLNTLVAAALKNNFDLKAAAARVEAAKQQVNISGATRWPQLSFIPGYIRSETGTLNTANSNLNIFNAIFSLQWEVDIWGRIKATQQATQQEAEAVSVDYYGANLSLAARTSQLYFEVIEANLQIHVAEQSIKDRRTIVDLVRGRFTKGLTRGLDLSLALTDLANAETQLAQSRNQRQLLEKNLSVLLGQYPDGIKQIQLQNITVLPNPPAQLAVGLPSDLLERRPDIKTAFFKLRAFDFKVESAKKALLPRITLTASGGTSSSALVDLIDPRAAAWNLAAGLVQPIFTGGRLTSEIHLNEALTKEAINKYQEVVLNAFREVEQTLAAEHWLRVQEQAINLAVAQTEASRKMAVTSYQQGLIDILTLLDSYRSTLNAQSSHLTVQRQLLTNRIDLYLALGGGV